MVSGSIVRRYGGLSKIISSASCALVPVLATQVETNIRLDEGGEVQINKKSVDAIFRRLKCQLEILEDADEPTVKASDSLSKPERVRLRQDNVYKLAHTVRRQ